MSTQWEDRHLQIGKCLTRSWPCWHPDLGCSASRPGQYLPIIQNESKWKVQFPPHPFSIPFLLLPPRKPCLLVCVCPSSPSSSSRMKSRNGCVSYFSPHFKWNITLFCLLLFFPTLQYILDFHTDTWGISSFFITNRCIVSNLMP